MWREVGAYRLLWGLGIKVREGLGFTCEGLGLRVVRV